MADASIGGYTRWQLQGAFFIVWGSAFGIPSLRDGIVSRREITAVALFLVVQGVALLIGPCLILLALGPWLDAKIEAIEFSGQSVRVLFSSLLFFFLVP